MRLNDLGFHRPPTPVGQGSRGFDKGKSLVFKSNVKSLASPCVTENDDLVLIDEQFEVNSSFSG